MDTKYCPNCGTPTQSGNYCSDCGAAIAETESSGSTAWAVIKGGVLVLGVLFLLLILISFMIGFFEGIQDSDTGAAAHQQAEQQVQTWFTAFSESDSDQLVALTHSNSPLAENLEDGGFVGSVLVGGEYDIQESSVVEQSAERIVVDVTYEYNNFGEDPDTRERRVELRKHEGAWELWRITTV